jgi:PAS domain S-box-containing protein
MTRGGRQGPGPGPAASALVVAMAGLLLSGGAALWQRQSNARQVDRLLATEVAALADRLERRLLIAEHGLRAARSIVLASGGPDRLPFSVYQSIDSLEREYPGVRGFGLVRRVPAVAGTDTRYVVQFMDPPAGNAHLVQADLHADPLLRPLADSAATAGQVLAGPPRPLPGGDMEIIALLGLRLPGSSDSSWVLGSLSGTRMLRDLTAANGPQALRVRDLDSGTVFGPSPWPAACGAPAQVDRFVFGRRWQVATCADAAYRAGLNLPSPGWMLAGGGLATALLASLAFLGQVGRQRRSEASDQRARLAAVVAQSSDAIITATPEGLVDSWNEAAVQMFDWTAAEAVGRPLAELLVPPDARPTQAVHHRHALRGDRPPPLDADWLRRDGTLVSVSVSMAPLQDADNSSAGVVMSLRDISQRKTLERELQGLNDRLAQQVATRTAELEAARRSLQDVIDGVPSLVSYFDRDLVCRFANLAHREWLGQDPSTLPGRPLRQLVDDAAYAEVMPALQRALQGRPASIYRDFPRPDGGTRRVLAHYRPDLRDGQVHGVHVLIHDVDELHQVQSRLNNILQGTAAGTWEWDLVRGVVTINHRMAEILGLPPQPSLDLGIEHWNAISHPDDLPEALRRQVAHWKGQTPLYEMEMRVRHQQGHWIWLRASGRVARRSASGRALDMQGIMLDISASRQAQQRLEDSERRFRLFAANVDEGVVVADKGMLIDASEVWLAMMGLKAEQALGRPVLDFTAPHARAEVRSRIEHGDERPYESELMRTDGSCFPVLLRGRAITFEGRAARLTTVLDITQRKQFENELRLAREAAERASQAKSRFLANISHEIRTPLNAVIGLAYLFQDTGLSEPQRLLVGKIQLAGRALLALINDVLDLSKIEAGELGLQRTPLHLSVLLDDVHRLMAAQAEAKGLDLKLELATDLAPHVQGDELRLRQILVNLVGNAIKFTDHGGVTLRARPLPGSDGQRVRLEVQDTGIGIAPDLLDRLFQPFTQVDSSPTRRFRGTGLGLSIVRQLAQLMDGEVGVQSQPGLGSTFWVELPMPPADGVPDSGEVQPLSVLVADDNPQDREQLAQMARSLGWMVEAVADGDALVQRATERLQQGRAPDALLVDWRMPGRDGLQALAALVPTFAPAPVPAAVIVSASDAEQVHAVPEAALAAAVLTKPVNPSALFNAVNTAVAQLAGSHERLLSSTRMDLGPTLWLPGTQVLVVDDSDVNRDVARHLLQRQGAVVDEAADGEQALARLRSRAYDAVLMDVQMPVLDGNATTRALRALPGLGTLPVIALTAGALLSERQQSLDAGMTDFLTKPLEPVMLVRTLRRHIERARGQPLPAQTQAGSPGAVDDWPQVPGIHGAEARERLGGDRALFLRLLRRMLDEFGPPLQGLADTDTDTDTDNPTIDASHWAAQLHKLRGAAGTLAARDLQRLAGHAEWAAAQPDAAGALAQALPPVARALQQLARDAAPWLQAGAAQPLPALRRLLRQLSRRLRDRGMGRRRRHGAHGPGRTRSPPRCAACAAPTMPGRAALRWWAGGRRGALRHPRMAAVTLPRVRCTGADGHRRRGLRPRARTACRRWTEGLRPVRCAPRLDSSAGQPQRVAHQLAQRRKVGSSGCVLVSSRNSAFE